MKLACLVVSATIWSVCAYTKGSESPKQMIRNMCEPVVSVRKGVVVVVGGQRVARPVTRPR